MVNMQQDRSALVNFKDRINDAIKRLRNSKQYINNAIKEMKKAYTGQVVREKTSKLESDIQQINNIEKELQSSVAELNQKINSLNQDINVKESEYRSL